MLIPHGQPAFAACMRAKYNARHSIAQTASKFCVRSFTTTPKPQRLDSKVQLARDHEDVPEYPHGPARLYKKSNFGLYGGKRVRFGNIVSGGKWVKKTRRKWWPNVQERAMYSEALKKNIQLKLTTAMIRTIDKVGGLDNYLLGSKSARIRDLGMKGWKLRWDLLQTPQVQARMQEERAALGLTSEKAIARVEAAQAIQEEFKEQFKRQPVEVRAKAFQEKRRRKDVWHPNMLAEFRRQALEDAQHRSTIGEDVTQA